MFQIFVESLDTQDNQAPFTESQLWHLLDQHANTIRLYVSLPEQSPVSQGLHQKAAGDPVNQEGSCESAGTSSACRKPVEAILEESTERLKNLSLLQHQQQLSCTLGGNGDGMKSAEGSDFETIESPSQETELSASVDNRELENRIPSSDAEVPLQSEEKSDSDVNNDRSTSSVDSDILSSSHSSDTLCNADTAPISLSNGLDSHSITYSRRSKASEGKKETWDTAEEDSGTDSEYDENGKCRGLARYIYFRAEHCTSEDGSGDGQKSMLHPVLSAYKRNFSVVCW